MISLHNQACHNRFTLRNLAITVAALGAAALSSPACAFQFGPFKIEVKSESAASNSGTPVSQAQDEITDPGVLAVSSMNPPRVWPTSPHCRPNSFTIPTDVDTAYARAMRKFTFRTEEEVRAMERRTEVYRTDPIYKHTAKAGSFYRMEQIVKVAGASGESRSLHLSMTLSKEKNGTFVEANYCTDPRNADASSDAYHAFIKKTIRDTFK